MNNTFLIACLMLLPLPALAAPKCEHSKPIATTLDLAGVTKVMFEVNAYDLTVNTAAGRTGTLDGRACASTADLLTQLEVTQTRHGDTLHVAMRRRSPAINITLGSFYTGLYLNSTVPDDVLVQLKVGSGDARVSGARSLSVDLGSGDVVANNTRERATVAVGSGDVILDGAGSLHVLSLGSGDLTARNVRGNVQVGTVGSGDLEVATIGGSASLDDLGSGDVVFKDVTGNVTVGAIGSGEVRVERVGGNLSVARKGSGDVNHSGIKGKVSLPRTR